MNRLLALLCFFFLLTPAIASQGSLCLPTTGTVSGLTLVTDINAGLDALVTSNSGASAPANPCGAAPEAGQMWLNTNPTPDLLEIYDGTNWQTLGAVNASTHFWTPPIGGGANTVASATTTDLGSVADGYVNITGTTTITSFGSSAVTGTLKVVKFAGILTLTYNATSLILPTAANITTAAGDTAIVVSLGGGNNIVVSYTRADGSPLDIAKLIQAGTTNTITTGYTLTPFSIGTVSSGTTTLSGANGNYQYLTNGGAFTLAAPGTDTAIDLLVTNNGSAGTITFSGFTVSSNTGDPLTTTNTSKFLISVVRINGTSTYSIKALQ